MAKKKFKKGLSHESKTAELLFILWQEAKKRGSFEDICFILDRRKFFKRDFERLKKAKMIKETKKEALNISFSFTSEGILEAVKIEIDQAVPFRDEKKACLVCFDVPEKKKSVRKLLRRYLNQWGFLPIQKSVWVSSFDLVEPIGSFIRLAKLNKWVQVFVVEEKKSIYGSIEP